MPGHLNQFQVQITSAKGGGSKSAGQTDKGNDVQKGALKGDKKGMEQPSTLNPQIPWQQGIDVGSVLKIKGQLTKFREMMQVDVIKIDIIGSTELEVKCWEEVFAFRRDVLSKPWVVSAEEGKRCEEKASGRDRDKKKDRYGDGRRKGDGGVREGQGKGQSRGTETEEERRRRHELKKRKMGKEKEREAEGLDPANKINYPSMAVRRRVAGKYETLGI